VRESPWPLEDETQYVRHPEAERYRGVPLRRIEAQGRDSQPRRSRAGNVGGTDVVAARLGHVLSSKDAHQQVAEGNGPQQIRNCDYDKSQLRQC